jgi:hypothetical protein
MVSFSSTRILACHGADFDRLLEKEIPRMRRYPRALTRDLSRADDLVQDTECDGPGGQGGETHCVYELPLRSITACI